MKIPLDKIMLGVFTFLTTSGIVRAASEMNLDFDWHFKQFEIYNVDQYGSSDREPQGLYQPACNDLDWRMVHLPHDFSIEGKYDIRNPMKDRCGYLPAGIGWYRKLIDVPEQWQGKRIRLEFDGVFRKSTVWVNGVKMGYRPYGWISFGYDITDAIKGRKQALIAVRVNNSQPQAARWYTGSGIYAPVRIHIYEPIHVAPWGVFVRSEMQEDHAQLSITTELQNESTNKVTVQLHTYILDPAGTKVNEHTAEATILPDETIPVNQKIKVSSPQLWSCENPNLYQICSDIVSDGKIIDQARTRTGIRKIEWKTETGFWLNGENIKLKGVCNHQDAGPFGAAVPDKILRYRLQQLKDMGCNAFRTAHNPQTPVFYDMCDEMGILVMDEIFDGWMQKAADDYGAQDFDQWWRTDVTDWIRRDRNHPSIVIYSVGNETRSAGHNHGKTGAELVQLCNTLDPTRPVTSGHSESDAMNVYGVNGNSEKNNFVEQHSKDLTKPFVATEYPHTWQVRGFYNTQTWYRDGYPNAKQRPFFIPNLTDEEIFYWDWTRPENKTNLRKQIFNSSYDNATVRISSRQAWQQVRDTPWWSGQFRWTGHDYLGEAGFVHGGWPFKAFMGGAIDLVNFEKDLYYIYQSLWTTTPMVHIQPHWTHPMLTKGTRIPVHVYTNCDEVELFVNGQSLGRKQPGTQWDRMQCEWLVPYQPGKIEAVAYRNNTVAARTAHQTASAPRSIELSSDTTDLLADGRDIAQVAVSVLDGAGNFYPYGENRIYFHLGGPAKIRTLGNGSPIDVEPYYGVNNRKAFMGKMRAFIESRQSAGPIQLIAAAICGEKQLWTSDQVSIDVQQLSLRGDLKKNKVTCYYTTDGSQPDMKSKSYTGPFSIKLPTTVKAAVYEKDQLLFIMEERFAEDEGLCWIAPSQQTPTQMPQQGMQAEDAALQGHVKDTTEGKGFNGQGFAEFKGDGSVTWFVENDGAAYDGALIFRYAAQDRQRKGRELRLKINGKVVADKLFFQNTGSWFDDWKGLTTTQRIDSGSNKITLETTGQGGVCIDELKVVPEVAK